MVTITNRLKYNLKLYMKRCQLYHLKCDCIFSRYTLHREMEAKKKQQQLQLEVFKKTEVLIDWKSSLFPYFDIPWYHVDKKIMIITFSATSPDVVYALTFDEVLQIDIIQGTATKMNILGVNLNFSHSIPMYISCLGTYLYLAVHLYLYKFEISGDVLVFKSLIREYSSCFYMYNGKKYCIRNIAYFHVAELFQLIIMDIEGQSVLAYTTIFDCVPHGITVTGQGKVHIATSHTVLVYENMERTGTYLDHHFCHSIASSSTTVLVGVKYAVVGVCPETCHVLYTVTVPEISFVWCSLIDDTLGLVHREKLMILPKEVYRPPYCLASLCLSVIQDHYDQLPVGMLPPALLRLVHKHRELKTQHSTTLTNLQF